MSERVSDQNTYPMIHIQTNDLSDRIYVTPHIAIEIHRWSVLRL